MGNLLLSKLNGDAMVIAEQFQRLVVQSYRSRCQEWTGAYALLQDLAERMQCLTHVSSAVSDPIAVARTLNISVRFLESRVPKLCGALFPVAGGFETAVYRRDASAERLSPKERFTIAHECGHAFFYHLDGGTPKRILPRLHHRSSPLIVVPLEEDLCDGFARALLVPISECQYISSKETTMTELLSAATDFDVSFDMLLLRIIRDLKAWPQTVYRLGLASSGAEVEVIQSEDRNCGALLPRARLIAELAGGKTVQDAIVKLKERFQLSDEHIAHDNQLIWLRM